MAAQTDVNSQQITRQHSEPERPLMYEPPDLRGRKHVEKVTGQYRVLEDECLADKLQNEEFELHFGKNKDMRKIGQIDIKKAKSIYLEEVAASGLLTKEELNRLCTDDKYLADEIDKRLNEEVDLEAQRKQALEMQDEEFARYLEAKEKEKLERERRKRLQRRIEQDRQTARRLQLEEDKAARKLSESVAALTVESGPPAPASDGGWAIDMEVGSTRPRTKVDLQQLKDAEIARKLQLQEDLLERKKTEEERDRRLAIKLQQKEAERYEIEKIENQERRERARLRAMEKAKKAESYQIEVALNRPQLDVIEDEDKRKHLHSVDATGKPVDQGSRNDHQSTPQRHSSHGKQSRPLRHGSHGQQFNSAMENPRSYGNGPQREGSHHRQSGYVSHDPRDQVAPQRQGSREHQKDRYIEALHDPRYGPDTARQSSREGSKNGKEEIYLVPVDAMGQPVLQTSRSREKGNLQHQRNQSRQQRQDDSRLLDEQRILQDQMRQISSMEGQLPPVSERHDVHHQENRHFDNVARDIDPTYQRIDTLPQRKQEPAPYRNGDTRPVPVQNQKRPSVSEGDKKKKRLFSKKKN